MNPAGTLKGLALYPAALLLVCTAACGRVAPPAQSAPGARGGEVMLFAADSPTAVLVVTAECAKCRIGVGTYGDVQALALREGFGFRSVIASGPRAAHQFALLLPDAEQVALDADSAVLRGLRVRTVPALVLLDGARKRRRVLRLEVPKADTARIRYEIRAFQKAASSRKMSWDSRDG